MCTLVILDRVRRDYPLILAANRDEFYARATEGPGLLVASPRVVGGRDLDKGGSWLAVSATGNFAAVTNQRTWVAADRTLRSRGEVVVETARCVDMARMHAYVSALDPRAYNSFNLAFGNADGVWIAYLRTNRPHVEIERVAPGIHVLPNGRLNSPDFPKVARLKEQLTGFAGGPYPLLEARIEQSLCDHRRPPIADVPAPPVGSLFTRELVCELHATCVHTPAYGTRSASFVALVPGGVARYRHASGAPCQVPFEDRIDLFQ